MPHLYPCNHKERTMQNFYAIEAGGTKFVCAWGSDPNHLYDRVTIPTTTPEDTLPKVIAHIKSIQKKVTLSAIGAAVFGPIGINPDFPDFGYITSTPKLAWRNFPFVSELQKETHLPVFFDTDVNVTAMGEHQWGAGKTLTDFIYMTVGTGIGAGAIVNNRLCHGAMHPEMGHLLIPLHPDDKANGTCHYHKNCLEGLASGPALCQKWGVSCATQLPLNHIAWEIEAYYLATALMNYTLCLSPKRIILGGGVMQQAHLLPKIRSQLHQLIGGYVSNHYLGDMTSYITKPHLSNNAGILGAIALAKAYTTSLNCEKEYV